MRKILLIGAALLASCSAASYADSGLVSGLAGRLNNAPQNGARSVAYQSTATGTTARTVQSKLDETVSVLDFPGCDTTGASDSYACIQAAINSFPTTASVVQNGGVVTVPVGKFKLSASLNLTGRSGVRLVGAGRQATVLAPTGNFPAVVDNGTRTAVDNHTGVESMWIQCAGLSNTSAHGVAFTYVNQGRIRDLFFTGCYHALDMHDQWQTVISDIRVDGAGAQQNYDGLFAGPPTDSADTMPNNALIVTNMQVKAVSNIGYELQYFAGSKFTNDEAENGVNGWSLCNAAYSTSTLACQFGHFANILSDTTSGAGILIQEGANTNAVKDLQFTNVWVGNSASYAFLMNGVTHTTVRGLHIATADEGIRVKQSNNVTVDADIHNYNKSNNGNYAVVMDAASSNNVTVHTQTAQTVLGYNGIEEINSSSGNQLWGGPASCTLGVAFGGGSTGLTYSAQACQYDVRGMTVNVQYYVGLSAVGSSGGSATLTGLPVQPGPATTFYYGGLSPVMANSGFASLAGTVLAEAAPGTTTANLYTQGAAGNVPVTNANFSNSSVLYGRLSYFKQ
ncbi:glycosyl hydrolase family 28-related protein [Burkholderia sp. GS2Y]|uniref:Glycosyl hydrolase family 28-related protein n=1 Tax=Burkholderia theae TaxID=3143496 RepID=A0ABU9WG82_9BURK